MPGTKDVRTWDYSHGGWINFEMETSNDVVSKGTLKMKAEGLILVVGASDRSANEIIPQISYSDYWGELKKAHFFDNGAAHQPQDFTGTTMEYGIEIEGGSGGWKRMSGPFAVDAVDWCSFVVAPIFPRTQPELKLRVTRNGTKPIELAIPNPAFGRTIASWKADEKPWTKTLRQGILQVDEFGLGKHKRTGRVRVEAAFSLTNKEHRKPQEFSIYQTTVSDETGNKENWRQFAPLDGTPRLKIGGVIRPSNKYQWLEREVVFLGEGICLGDSEVSEIILGNQTEKYAVLSITFKKEKAHDIWHFTLERDISKLLPPPTIAETPLEYGGVLFIDGEKVSTKSVNKNGRETGRQFGAWVDYKNIFSWSGKIAKGQKIRFGIVPTDRDEEFEFILPTSEMTAVKP